MELDEAAWWENYGYGEEADVNAVGMGRGEPQYEVPQVRRDRSHGEGVCITVGHARQGWGSCQRRR